jgi:hypothetical protein
MVVSCLMAHHGAGNSNGIVALMDILIIEIFSPTNDRKSH